YKPFPPDQPPADFVRKLVVAEGGKVSLSAVTTHLNWNSGFPEFKIVDLLKNSAEFMLENKDENVYVTLNPQKSKTIAVNNKSIDEATSRKFAELYANKSEKSTQVIEPAKTIDTTIAAIANGGIKEKTESNGSGESIKFIDERSNLDKRNADTSLGFNLGPKSETQKVTRESVKSQPAAIEACVLQSKVTVPLPRSPAVPTTGTTISNHHVEQRVDTNLIYNNGISPLSQEFQNTSTIPSKTELPPPPTKYSKPTAQSNTLIDFDDLTSSFSKNVPISDKHILPNILPKNNLTASEKTFLEYCRESAESSFSFDKQIDKSQESKTNLEPNFSIHNLSDKHYQIYLNFDIPFSSVITGAPNSGVDLMLQNILEGGLIQNPCLGGLNNPLSALIFRFDSTSDTQPSYRALLGTSQQSKVIVLLSPSNYRKMSSHYKNIENCEVRPLFFSENELCINSIKAWLTIKGDAQIYDQCVELIDDILYDLGDYFDYSTFRNLLLRRTTSSSLLLKVKEFFTSRLNRLDSLIIEKLMQSIKQKGFWNVDSDDVMPLEALFQPGVAVIADLSDDVLNKEMISILFDIILKIYIRSNNPECVNGGKLVVLDEAHKFFTSDSQLAETLQRLQSHLYQHNARLVITTHDPTLLPPPILYNSDFHVLHYFLSPAWSNFLTEHVAFEYYNTSQLLQRVMQLKRGQQAFL
ncbi:4849_t:CDS:2, partial [Ambispora leptoticha]